MNKKKENPVVLLIRWAGRDRYYLYVSMLCSFLSGLFTIGPYLGLYRVMEAVLTGTATAQNVSENVMIITVSSILRLVFLGTSGVLSHKGAYKALFSVRCMITEHLGKVPLGVLDERGIGEIKTVLNEDIEKLELCLAHNLPELISYLTGPVVIFVYLMTVNVWLALISIIPLPIAVLIMAGVYQKMMAIMQRTNLSLSAFNSVMIEYISGMRLIKAYNMGSQSFKKFSGAIQEENALWIEITRKTAPPYAAFNIILECGMLLLVPIGGMFFMRGSITASVFLLFAYVGAMYLTEILPLQQLATTFAQALNGVSKAKELLDLPVYEGGSAFPLDAGIHLKNVSFSYDGNTAILKNCNLEVPAGKKLALVGASGAGKSTIVELISRFYNVDDGAVEIGGKNVKAINYDALLQNISIVFQRTFLTRDSVLENIRMGHKASLEEVRKAAEQAQIDGFIMSLPDGYNTKVGSFGSRFSGGEKQRIAIARAILKNAPILILDEATSAADPENQVEIDMAITNLCRGKTVIIVAHRLGVVKMCDRVAVVEHHRVTDCGSHEEIRSRNAYYRKSWESYEAAREIAYQGKGSDNDENK